MAGGSRPSRLIIAALAVALSLVGAPGATPARGEAVVRLESPAAGSVAGTVNVVGWAADPDSADGTGVAGVEVWLHEGAGDESGVRLGEALYGLPRPDVVNATGRPDFAASGFAFEWTPRWPGGSGSPQRTLRVVAVDAAGAALGSASAVLLLGQPAPVAAAAGADPAAGPALSPFSGAPPATPAASRPARRSTSPSSSPLSVTTTVGGSGSVSLTVSGLEAGESVTATAIAPGGSVYSQGTATASTTGVATVNVTINTALAGKWTILISSGSGRGGSVQV